MCFIKTIIFVNILDLEEEQITEHHEILPNLLELCGAREQKKKKEIKDTTSHLVDESFLRA